MTRKHYEAIAREIRLCMHSYDAYRQVAVRNLAEKLADYFASNKKFNRDNFMKLCFLGVNDERHKS